MQALKCICLKDIYVYCVVEVSTLTQLYAHRLIEERNLSVEHILGRLIRRGNPFLAKYLNDQLRNLKQLQNICTFT